MTEHRLEYRVLPRGEAVAALDVLREAAGLGPWRDDGEEVGGDEQGRGRGAMSCDEWVAQHRCQGHHPHPAPTNENRERWECKCNPEAVWTAVWRILTPSRSGRSSHI